MLEVEPDTQCLKGRTAYRFFAIEATLDCLLSPTSFIRREEEFSAPCDVPKDNIYSAFAKYSLFEIPLTSIQSIP